MDTLVATAIHDAKNSLNLLNSWLDEAERLCPSPPLAQARSAAAHVAAQLTELLALYRETQGVLRLVIDDQNLADFIDDLRQEIAPEVAARAPVRLEWQTEVADRLGVWAFDGWQVKLLLTDALRNALRHATSHVVFRLDVEPSGGLRFTVQDDGPGFPAALLAGTEAEPNAEGSGLGLRFARLIARRHATPDGRHGHLELTNDGGARLSLFLP